MKDRLIFFQKYLGIGQNKFAELCGLSRGYVNNVGDSIREVNIAKIKAAFPQLNTNWLKTGEGEMLCHHATIEVQVDKQEFAMYRELFSQYKEIIKEKDKEIAELNRTIGQLQERVRTLEAAPAWEKSMSSARTKNAKEFAKLPI